MSGYYGRVHVKASWRNQTEIGLRIDDGYHGTTGLEEETNGYLLFYRLAS
jgi:hypothetical protein